MAETVTIAGQGISIDLLLWRKWGEGGRKLLAQVQDLNPGISALGVFLPPGTVVILPEAGPTRENATTTAAIDLFS